MKKTQNQVIDFPMHKVRRPGFQVYTIYELLAKTKPVPVPVYCDAEDDPPPKAA